MKLSEKIYNEIVKKAIEWSHENDCCVINFTKLKEILDKRVK